MELQKIITLANAQHRLRFVLMERSLRAVGCDVPIWVIPFDDDLFDLPPNSHYWSMPDICDWIRQSGISNRKRKYQCLTTDNYQYVDTDVFFLRNPQEVLEPHRGLVACCNEWTWSNQVPNCAVTHQSYEIMRRRTTMWHQYLFCAGQFACDEPLYSPTELIEEASWPEHRATCMEPPHGDQPGINLLAFLSGVDITNLTLPPYRMESSWIGDYPDRTWRYWRRDPARQPYLIHYYGFAHLMHLDRPIMQTFRELLTKQEQEQFVAQAAEWNVQREAWDRQRHGLSGGDIGG